MFSINTIKEYWVILTVIMLIFITTASLWPLEYLPAVPGSDKTHHFISYALLALPVAIRRPSYWPIMMAFFVVWGGAIELIQPFVNRYGEWLDLAANSSGILLGVLISFFISIVGKYFQKRLQ